jgi:hypothetical protein
LAREIEHPDISPSTHTLVISIQTLSRAFVLAVAFVARVLNGYIPWHVSLSLEEEPTKQKY